MSSSIVGNEGSNFWMFNPAEGFDLTHTTPRGDARPSKQLKLMTTSAPVVIDPDKTALVIVDMQNFFLSTGLRSRGEGHKAEDMLLSTAIPAARKSGIQVIHLTWGISDEELAVLPPVIFRAFGFMVREENRDNFDVPDVPIDGEQEVKLRNTVGDDLGDFELSAGSTVAAGRMLMRDQWNTALHEPLQAEFEKSQALPLPDIRFHKNRVSGFCGASNPCVAYLREHNITTLLFTGVNTDQCVAGSLQDACNLGFDTILLKDGCGTSSPDYARQMVEHNCRKNWGFVSSCKALANTI